MNFAVIMGRLTADPELRKTPSGVSVAKFTVAVDRRYKSGEEKIADFINVTAWRGAADFVCKYFKKGSMIAVQGNIQTGYYEKDGVKRYTFEVVADEIGFCGGKQNSQNDNQSEQNNISNPLDVQVLSDEDLPF